MKPIRRIKPEECEVSWDRKPLRIKDDQFSGVIEIEGIKYSYEMFQQLGVGGALSMAVGDVFQIIERGDGVLVLRRLDDSDPMRTWFK